MKRDWTWKKLQDGEPKYSRLDIRPDTITNEQGIVVRYHAPHPVKPTIERFFDQIVEVEVNGETCWQWQASEQFWVRGSIVISPWRYSYELLVGRKIPPGANFRWLCNTPRCVQPEHLQPIGLYCQKRLR